MSDADTHEEESSDEVREAVVLDYLAHGRSDDDRPQYQKSPLVYALGTGDFQLFEITVDRDTDASIGDTLVIDPKAERTTGIERIRRIDWDDLSGGAKSELEYAVTDIVEADERRFVDFYNDAQPVTLRLHQLNLLPGIGKKLRNTILDKRKRKPFESFDEMEERVKGLHDPEGIIVDRIMEELSEKDLKYRTFVRQTEQD